MNRLSFQTNNGEMIVLFQEEDDAKVGFSHWNDEGEVESLPDIPAPDFVMLLNYYRYVKTFDIRNGFINPHGKNKEE